MFCDFSQRTCPLNHCSDRTKFPTPPIQKWCGAQAAGLFGLCVEDHVAIADGLERASITLVGSGKGIDLGLTQRDGVAHHHPLHPFGTGRRGQTALILVGDMFGSNNAGQSMVALAAPPLGVLVPATYGSQAALGASPATIITPTTANTPASD